MFTGIIEELGKVQSITQNKITIHAQKVLENTKPGDSIAVDGVCLTVTNLQSDCFDADISPETKKVTTLLNLKAGSFVNLERALTINGRLGGHFVTGHVDGLGKIKFIKKENGFYIIKIELPQDLTKYTAKKSSVTVNGISLTIADTDENNITLAIIPHTYENTNLKILKTDNFVNIETDILSKYVEKFLLTSDNKSGISMDFLMENGFCEV